MFTLVSEWNVFNFTSVVLWLNSVNCLTCWGKNILPSWFFFLLFESGGQIIFYFWLGIHSECTLQLHLWAHFFCSSPVEGRLLFLVSIGQYNYWKGKCGTNWNLWRHWEHYSGGTLAKAKNTEPLSVCILHEHGLLTKIPCPLYVS